MKKKMQLPKIGHSISKLKILFLKTQFFFSKCSSFNAEFEYQIGKFLRTLDFNENSVSSTSIAEKPWFSGNPTPERFGENFPETKRKSTSRNSYKPKDNSMYSAVIKMVFSCNTSILGNILGSVQTTMKNSKKCPQPITDNFRQLKFLAKPFEGFVLPTKVVRYSVEQIV